MTHGIFMFTTLLATVFSTVGFLSVGHAAGGLSDRQIAEVLITINQGEIDAAKIAKNQAQNSEVKAFADKMLHAHDKNRDETKSLARKNSLSPESSDMSRTLTKDAQSQNQDLKRTTKSAFDQAYVNEQVTMHQKALATLENDLIPAVKNAELRAHLQATKADVADHLTMAKNLQSSLEKTE